MTHDMWVRDESIYSTWSAKRAVPGDACRARQRQSCQTTIQYCVFACHKYYLKYCEMKYVLGDLD